MNAPTPLSNPAAHWRRLCWVGDTRIALCGDLDTWSPAAGYRQLTEWVDAGITHIIDVRGEHSDEEYVAEVAPHITYVYLGTHDDGGAQDPEWFDAGVSAALKALADPDAKVVIHCHMGVNRGPSMGFAVLLALGLGIEEALDAIRAARPIAAVLYAESAVMWWTTSGAGAVCATELPSMHTARRVVREWHRANPIDVGWIISRIRRAEVG